MDHHPYGVVAVHRRRKYKLRQSVGSFMQAFSYSLITPGAADVT
jgi:hypothetical protein